MQAGFSVFLSATSWPLTDTFVIAVVTVASYVNRQNAIDHWHGAHEDM